ncbi:MAG: hypothetical protein M1274_11675 [Actinobacteria bacterium]|nr:hypothetical protein [Actinomycetota bacterium]
MNKDDPSGFRRLQSEVDRMFLELLRDERAPRYGRISLRPNADVYFDGRAGAIVVKLELAGIDPSKVSLEIEDGVLRVSGSRVDPWRSKTASCGLVAPASTSGIPMLCTSRWRSTTVDSKGESHSPPKPILRVPVPVTALVSWKY